MMIIKKEADRKFYNSETKKYITLNDIFLLIRQNLKIKIIDYQDADITKDVVKKAIMTHCKDSDEALEIMYDYFNREPVLVSEKFIVIDRAEFEKTKDLNDLMSLLEKISHKESENKIKNTFKFNTKYGYSLIKTDRPYRQGWHLLKNDKAPHHYILMASKFDLINDKDELVILKNNNIDNNILFIVLVHDQDFRFNIEEASNLILKNNIMILDKSIDFNPTAFIDKLKDYANE